MNVAKSCGFLVVRGDPAREFLLMRHADRWDLPKGHVDPGETELQCALRELREETGIGVTDIELVGGFRFESHYPVRAKNSGELYEKTLVVFLGRLQRNVPIVVTEHLGYEWFAWNPPHQIQATTIDPLLDSLAHFLEGGAA
jgi:8-oxo-dGTP pyrophosphatase MutT (NUDIX family)